MRICGVRLAVFAVAAGFTCASAWLPTAAMAAADPGKVIRWYFRTGESGFDPVRVSDENSATVIEAIFERLLTYDYLARPARLSPMAAEGLPEITDNGRTYTFRIRKGVYFAPDPAFKGKQRELTAQDFVYSYLRFMDPKNRAPYAFLLAGKLVGMDELFFRGNERLRVLLQLSIDVFNFFIFHGSLKAWNFNRVNSPFSCYVFSRFYLAKLTP